MKAPGAITVGVCSHTGLVRSGNEDDYLLVHVPGTDAFVAAIADGMGGAAGGAEASRTALRALGAELLEGGERPVAERLARGFQAASARVRDAASAVPALRDMGTTLTALWLGRGEAVVGHVGDTRLYRVRDGMAERLTTDHVLREGENLLTRCVGAGQLDCEADTTSAELCAGDRFVLLTDGVWNVVAADELARLVRRPDPQLVAEMLVRRALEAGGPDNATAVVVDVRDPALQGVDVDVDLPRGERPGPRATWPSPDSLRLPLWPWLLLAAAAAALVWTGLRWSGVDLFDLAR